MDQTDTITQTPSKRATSCRSSRRLISRSTLVWLRWPATVVAAVVVEATEVAVDVAVAAADGLAATLLLSAAVVAGRCHVYGTFPNLHQSTYHLSMDTPSGRALHCATGTALIGRMEFSHMQQSDRKVASGAG